MKRVAAPIIVFSLLTAVIVLCNFSLFTPVWGWDNLLVELNFWTNIKRTLFSVWQQNEGLGSLAGNAFSADLPRQLMFWLASWVFPTHFLRQVFLFAALFLGGYGMYRLLADLLGAKNDKRVHHIGSIFGGIFYIGNLATIQAFYVPFEPFIVQFAALPWLFLVVLRFLWHPSKKAFGLLVLVNILAMPMFQVPTVFLVYVGILLVIFATEGIRLKRKTLVKHCGIVFASVLLINAMWLVPFAYFTLTNSKVAVLAKINQMSTETVYAENKAYGDPLDVMLLKGFWFSSTEPNEKGIFTYIFAPWKGHIENPFVALIGIGFFLIILYGVYRSIRDKETRLYSLVALFVISFGFLAITTPPFSWINDALRFLSPFLSQVFRFPFTKFSTLASAMYAIFFAYGIMALLPFVESEKVMKWLARLPFVKNGQWESWRHDFPLMKKLTTVRGYVLVVSIAFIIYMLPLFGGHLFYSRVKSPMPSDYQNLFAFFQRENSNARIANFPQANFWGWTYYDFGYGGSGFLWYGIPQPILDRAFDVWSAPLENYYFEITNAVYAKDAKHFASVIHKYDIQWLLVDEHVVDGSSVQARFIPQLESLIATSGIAKKYAVFGKITVYKVTDTTTKDFISLHSISSHVNDYAWGSKDQGYSDLGDYVSGKNQQQYWYPFRSLFSGKTENEQAFTITQTKDFLYAKSVLPAVNTSSVLRIPSFGEKEHTIAATFFITKEGKQNTISVKVQTPEVFVDGKKVYGVMKEYPLFVLDSSEIGSAQLDINGAALYPIRKNDGVLGTTFLSLSEQNVLTLSNKKIIQTQSISDALLKDIPSVSVMLEKSTKQRAITIAIPKISDGYIGSSNLKPQDAVRNCDLFRAGSIVSPDEMTKPDEMRLYAQNASACQSFYLSRLFHDQGYVFFITYKNLQGRAPRVWVENTDEHYGSIDTYLPKTAHPNDVKTVTLVQFPMEKFGRAYTLHLESESIGSDISDNVIQKVSEYPIPYTFLTALVQEPFAPEEKMRSGSTDFTVSHPNESLYEISNLKSQIPNNTTLVLSQAYDSGWKAYQITNHKSQITNMLITALPFLFGSELKDHVKVNNWENGWTVSKDQRLTTDDQIIIVYWPQYLQYAGFMVFFGFVMWIVVYLKKK